MGKTLLISGFQQSRAEYFMNFDGTTNHFIRQIAKFSSLHYLHVLHGNKTSNKLDKGYIVDIMLHQHPPYEEERQAQAGIVIRPCFKASRICCLGPSAIIFPASKTMMRSTSVNKEARWVIRSSVCSGVKC